MKKLVINCNFGGQIAPFTVMIGQPKPDQHPLHFQANWLSTERGGVIPAEVMDSITQLVELSKKYQVPIEELVVYALGSAQGNNNTATDNNDQDNNNQAKQESQATVSSNNPND
ncbi:Uncharacterised protein [Orientia tsutsugamushi]|uniref:DUF2610 domain-containing protein n=2 Tax=Orientia tsutsugamushi TaxID=784 RepID=A0A0F3RKX2_ORITS|nr:DUF2610 domain-containing protein [Orientia tsutsugamushi]KJV75383.1 hypothetical protein OTSUT76_2706 [Orientia tsutsugamushi str. UT76]KJW06098.1 hypothetical protein OTUT144_1867 [Orientia tsutsugamushi str. UT144]KJW06938.1 hypothetical protein OTUT144_1027 [Orientia tsutsugamushi str. UT144]SPR04058.1 Uncharacterised protein [Orientia tsutsugamushi]